MLPALIFGTLAVLGPLRLSALGVGAIGIGAVWLSAGALETLNNLLVIGRASDRHGPLVPIRAALIGTIAGTVLLPWPQNKYVLAVLIVVSAVAFGSFYTPGMTMLHACGRGPRARLRVRLRPAQPRLGAGPEHRVGAGRRGRRGDARRGAVPDAGAARARDAGRPQAVA